MIDTMAIKTHKDEVYQPIPFLEYEKVEAQRKDCGERYRIIKYNYGDFKDKTLIDICCANGYFPFRFLQDGGKTARGIEEKKELSSFMNALAFEKNMDLICDTSLNGLFDVDFDIGIYLDTHFHEETKGYPEYLAKHTKVCFTSSAERSQDYVLLLEKLFKNVEPIYQGFMERIIYKCY